MLTYDPATIRSLATDVGYGRTVTELALAEGETAWNPASTKGPLFGPSTLVYDNHVSGITIHEFNPGVCAAPIGEDTGNHPALPGTTRCADHADTK